MYRPGSGTVRQTRYQGMGNRAPDPHDIISMHSGSEEAQRKAQFAHLQALLKDAIRDEEDAIKKYQYLIDEILKLESPYLDALQAHNRSVVTNIVEVEFDERAKKIGILKHIQAQEQIMEILKHIQAQEYAHKALLERIIKQR